MTTWKWWMRGGLLVAGAPALSGCYLWPQPPGGSGGGGGDCGRSTTVIWNGGYADGGIHDGGQYLEWEDCQGVCPDAFNGAMCSVPDAGLLKCEFVCIGGRAPPGLQALSKVNGTAGAWVARMAELETAAVHAFAQLADELDTHGLPAHAQHAREAALDEVRHADAVTRLAMQLGYCPAPVRISPAREVRSLEAIAIDNAGEGCGRELFGAVVNQWQATHATDDRVRAVMGAIAGDERAHANYSFALADSLNARLTPAQRRRAKEAQEHTLSVLSEDEVPAGLRRSLGLMDGEQVASTAKGLLDSDRL